MPLVSCAIFRKPRHLTDCSFNLTDGGVALGVAGGGGGVQGTRVWLCRAVDGELVGVNWTEDWY